MQISMIFFTIIIEKRKKTPEERYSEYLQQKELIRLENEYNVQKSQFPEYLTRL